MILHAYWRSSASYRVRIGLNLKGIDYRVAAHDLRRDEQADPAYAALAPQKLVPALEIGDGRVLTQSMAILEWLDDAHPVPPLLPADPIDRAIVRGMALAIAADVQPLANLRVLRWLKQQVGAEQAAIDDWQRHWMGEGLAALETQVARHGGTHCFGDAVTLADVLLVPQWYNAARVGLDTTPLPRLTAIVAMLREHPAFAAAAPERQPDAD